MPNDDKLSFGTRDRMSYYVYILRSGEEHYIGSTKNLYDRLTRHNSRQNRSTKHKHDWKLIYHEVLPTLSEATKKEKYIKDFGVRRFLA